MKNTFFILSFLMCITSFAQNKKSFLRDGNKLYTDSSYNEAEIQYRKSLEKDQDYFNASFNLADAVYKQERYEESSALFDALKDNAPTETELAKVYHNLGNSLVKEQKLEEAIAAYKSALRINPNDKDTRHNLAITHQQKQQQKEQENKDENKEDKEDQKEDKEGENKEEEKENKEQEESQENKEQQEGKQENKPEEKKEEMSKEAAEKMLEAIQQQEKELQEELQKKKVKGKRVKVLKDW
ncbi:tetratricopeptide repeat protein [Flavobacteriales bacterium]|nr:tetratricopeptide repeat protein [Flavobacteriales bacterium]MDG1348858.1 tetratricopeptide repeat protein [Flavobacteriales bacterium]